ncbi:MAG: hypothetical protein ABIN13_10885, partial [Mucilaginibacter sp.]
AVGDAEFQKKCLGKMGDVSKGQGRTVLFVSHNLGSVRNLCTSAILLDKGSIVMNDTTQRVINHYHNTGLDSGSKEATVTSKCGRFSVEMPYWVGVDGHRTAVYTAGEKIILCFNFTFNTPVKKINPGFAILDYQDQRLFTSHLSDDTDFSFDGPLSGNVMLKTVIDLPLSPATYKVIYGVRDEFDNTVIYEENVILMIEESVSKNGAGGVLWYTSKWQIDKQ